MSDTKDLTLLGSAGTEYGNTYNPAILETFESKALKLYLFGFRQHGSFHEDCINTIAHDLFNLMQPHWIEVRGDFMPRGGISINPTVRLEK